MFSLLGSKPRDDFRLLKTDEIEKVLFDLIDKAEEEVVLVTPYATFGALTTLRRMLRSKLQQPNIERVEVVVRDEEKQVEPARKDLAELIGLGLQLHAVHRLHAKIYWTDAGAIVTSANLLDGSFESSVEVGIYVPSYEQVFDELGHYLDEKILGAAKEVSQPQVKARPRSARKEGHCIRCGRSIPRRKSSPLCRDDFRKWAQYENEDYQEKYCHGCGKPHATSKRYPFCDECFRKRSRGS